MDHEFWLTRWAEGRTGFHRDDVHPDLVAHEARFLAGGPHRVLVPLCGRSRDLAWLAERGHDVLGVELSPLAVARFWQDQGGTPEEGAAGPFVVGRLGRVAVACGDFFLASPALLGTFDRVWDRAALVAMDAARRPRYAAVVRGLLRAGGLLLQNSFLYDEERMGGPPFSVPDDAIATLYPNWPSERLGHVVETEGRFAESLPWFATTTALLVKPPADVAPSARGS